MVAESIQMRLWVPASIHVSAPASSAKNHASSKAMAPAEPVKVNRTVAVEFGGRSTSSTGVVARTTI